MPDTVLSHLILPTTPLATQWTNVIPTAWRNWVSETLHTCPKLHTECQRRDSWRIESRHVLSQAHDPYHHKEGSLFSISIGPKLSYGVVSHITQQPFQIFILLRPPTSNHHLPPPTWSWAPQLLLYRKNKSHQKREQLPLLLITNPIKLHPTLPSFPPPF